MDILFESLLLDRYRYSRNIFDKLKLYIALRKIKKQLKKINSIEFISSDLLIDFIQTCKFYKTNINFSIDIFTVYIFFITDSIIKMEISYDDVYMTLCFTIDKKKDLRTLIECSYKCEKDKNGYLLEFNLDNYNDINKDIVLDRVCLNIHKILRLYITTMITHIILSRDREVNK